MSIPASRYRQQHLMRMISSRHNSIPPIPTYNRTRSSRRPSKSRIHRRLKHPQRITIRIERPHRMLIRANGKHRRVFMKTQRAQCRCPMRVVVVSTVGMLGITVVCALGARGVDAENCVVEA